MVAAERVSEPLSLYPKLMQLVMQENFLSHLVAVKVHTVVFVCCAAENLKTGTKTVTWLLLVCVCHYRTVFKMKHCSRLCVTMLWLPIKIRS